MTDNTIPRDDEIEAESVDQLQMQTTLLHGFAWLVAFVVPIFWPFTFRMIKEWERGFIFRIGNFLNLELKPGLHIINPFSENLVIVDCREKAWRLRQQDLVTSDGMTIRVAGYAFMKVRPEKARAFGAIGDPESGKRGTLKSCMTILRAAVTELTLQKVVADRKAFENLVQRKIRREISSAIIVRIRIDSLTIPVDQMRSIAKKAETEVNRKAAGVSSLGELEMAQQMSVAAKELGKTPNGLTLRNLDTMEDIAKDGMSTMIFPFPMFIMDGFAEMNIDDMGDHLAKGDKFLASQLADIEAGNTETYDRVIGAIEKTVPKGEST